MNATTHYNQNDSNYDATRDVKTRNARLHGVLHRRWSVLQTIAGLLVIALMLSTFPSRGTAGIVYGLKSRFAGAASGPSTTPTQLFSFTTSGPPTFVDIGTVGISPIGPIDADGLAYSPVWGLMAFELQKSGATITGSRLVDINDSAPGSSSTVGPALLGRNIRGAAFDQADQLWVLDSANDVMLQINPATAAIIGLPIPLTHNNAPFDLGDVVDIAVRRNGTFHVTNATDIYTITPGGALTHRHTHTVSNLPQGLAGAAFDSDPGSDDFFTYDANGPEDIHRYDNTVTFLPQSIAYPNIIPSFNAGRGDLASIVGVPEPSALILLMIGMVSVLAHRRRGNWRAIIAGGV